MLTMAQAIRLALHYGEEHLGVTDIFGEDVGPPLGGVFTATQGLRTAWNSPLDERGIIAHALGLALAGQKPVCEIQFCDYIFNTIDLLKLAGNTHWTSAGQYNANMVCMTVVGAGIHGSVYHSHSFESIMAHIPGWKIVLPSRPIDAYGLMISALKDPNPVMFLYPKALIRTRGTEPLPGLEGLSESDLKKRIDAPAGRTLNEVAKLRETWQPQWPSGLTDYQVPIGQARRVRSGDDLTIISYARHVPLAELACRELAAEGISVDLIDLRSLYPWDRELVFESVSRTGRALVINEDTPVCNFGEHILREITEHCFYQLQAPPRLLAGADVPGIGLNPRLENASVPQQSDILNAARTVAQTVA
ncbi:MAG: alpha-ketoacid dehydrogenase subunit beta [Deltaproteobacteria bacterium]|nr:alpha-ketoacid dehydrogenase subunit beta [Deltaproteobacteria bacterium]